MAIDSAIDKNQIGASVIQSSADSIQDKNVEPTKNGTLNGQNVNIDNSNNVDASTKDDEVASAFKSEENTAKKNKEKKEEEAQKNRINATQKTANTKNVNHQDQRNRRVSKSTQLRLQIISEFASKDLSETITERSGKLFEGSEEAYKGCFEELDQANSRKNCTPDTVAKAINRFDDIAEKHNALQITVDVWERKLARLKDDLKNLRNKKESNPQAQAQSQRDQEYIQGQIEELEKNINTVQEAQINLMAEHGDRIEDSYKLAPLLREVFSQNGALKESGLTPKSFNALILDKVLPLKGDLVKTFECLTHGLIEELPPSSGSPIEQFKNNLDILKRCLSQELSSCPDESISAAILNSIRSTEKLETIQIANLILITKLSSVVSYQAQQTASILFQARAANLAQPNTNTATVSSN
jgi:chromosome segregation ATPase